MKRIAAFEAQLAEAKNRFKEIGCGYGPHRRYLFRYNMKQIARKALEALDAAGRGEEGS